MNARRIGVVSVGLALLFAGTVNQTPLIAQSSSYVSRNVQIVGGGFVPGIVFSETEAGLVSALPTSAGRTAWTTPPVAAGF